MRAAIFFLATIPYAAADVVDSDNLRSSQGACYDTVTHEAISSVLFNGAAAPRRRAIGDTPPRTFRLHAFVLGQPQVILL